MNNIKISYSHAHAIILNKGHKTTKFKPAKYKIAQAKSGQNKENFKNNVATPKNLVPGNM